MTGSGTGSPERRRSLVAGASTFGQHVLTFCAVMGVLWVAAKPAAQDFVESAVDSRISAIEHSIIALQQQQTSSDVSQAEIHRQIEQLLREQKEAGRSTDQIVRLLQQLLAEQR